MWLSVFCVYSTVPWVGLLGVIVAFPSHIHLFLNNIIMALIKRGLLFLHQSTVLQVLILSESNGYVFFHDKCTCSKFNSVKYY